MTINPAALDGIWALQWAFLLGVAMLVVGWFWPEPRKKKREYIKKLKRK